VNRLPGRLLALAASLLIVTAAGAEQRPVELVRAEVAAILQALDEQQRDPAARRHALSDRIARNFDFDDMARSILATNWKAASEAQRDSFKALFREILERKYVAAIEKRTTEVVRVGGERIRGDRASVIVTIERGTAADIPLLFKLKRTDDGWRAYDANVEGLSLVQHYRDEYAAIAKKEGMGSVLEHMRRQLAG
jgi:phospholipid transport system substrate-binding protein